MFIPKMYIAIPVMMRPINKYAKLSPKFIFLYPAYNFRNNEIGAVIGLNQLRSLDKNNKKRRGIIIGLWP